MARKAIDNSGKLLSELETYLKMAIQVADELGQTNVNTAGSSQLTNSIDSMATLSNKIASKLTNALALVQNALSESVDVAHNLTGGGKLTILSIDDLIAYIKRNGNDQEQLRLANKIKDVINSALNAVESGDETSRQIARELEQNLQGTRARLSNLFGYPSIINRVIDYHLTQIRDWKND